MFDCIHSKKKLADNVVLEKVLFVDDRSMSTFVHLNNIMIPLDKRFSYFC